MKAYLSTKEKQEIKLKLLTAIENCMEDITSEDNGLGYLPENIDALMADAAFAVLEAVNATNTYFQDEDMLK